MSNHLLHNIDTGATQQQDLKFTTAGDVMKDMDKPTGGETWQTKATQKGKVPRYYSPIELLSMRVDTLEEQVRNLNKRLSNISRDHLTELKEEDL